ncbi:hypothetical protein QTI33_12025 [Variovorax sp. J22P271]|uniref:hypothetical protein n=1 Tax=Variovorax davisae TaxID=3053515 RepID=UPI002575F084|nr:hypothetical protein [Variovorax sp. J22P271]MDM0032851.1 hypothetical protein [Variovorax sp. J22P271]
MEYTPSTIFGIEKCPRDDIFSLVKPALIRGLRIDDFSTNDGWLQLRLQEFDGSLIIRRDHRLFFGTEWVTAIEYLKRVLERGDLIDAVAHPAQDGFVPIDFFWIHIVYIGTPQHAGIFSQKEDGLFAMRAKAGEKAERIVARMLRDRSGHSFDARLLQTPGYFEIKYDETKRQRRPDLECARCGLTFEIKKRNRDTRFRVSHSSVRPFLSENSPLGWHAFVFPDMKPRFLSNAAIADAIDSGNFIAGADQHDLWADVHGDKIKEMQPPTCTAV